MQLSALTSALGRFVSELQRRKVIRVAAGYAVVGWIVLQVALALQTAMKLPDSFSTGVVSLLIIGFPVVLVLAWLFEFTPEGIKRTAPASGDGALVKPQTTDVILAGMLGLVLVVAMAQAFAPRATAPVVATTAAQTDKPQVETPALGDKSIAVLPFANLSPDKENEYFADGLTEELLNLLAKIGDLKVISRTSSFAFRGKNTPLPEIAKQLGVRHIVEGTVRRDGDDLRVIAQLIDVQTDTHLWSDTFDRKAENLLVLQYDIARAIAGALNVEVTLSDADHAPTKSLRAYRMYLEGLEFFRERDAALFKATALFNGAIELDPEFAEAHAALAASYWTQVALDRSKAATLAAQARASALTAIKLKPSLGLAYAVIGILGRNELKWESAVANARRAVALDPADSTARLWLGSTYAILGRMNESGNGIEEAFQLDPMSNLSLLWLVGHKFTIGETFEAVRLGDRLTRSAGWSARNAHGILALAAVDRGDAVNAEAHVIGYLRPDDRKRAWAKALIRAIHSPEAKDDAIRALQAELKSDPNFDPTGAYGLLLAEDALIDRLNAVTAEGNIWQVDPALLSSLWAPRYKTLRSKSEFKSLVKKLGYVDYWRKHGWADRCRAKGEDDFECS